MKETNSAPGQTVSGGLRLPAGLNALWIGGAAALDEKTAVRAFERLVEAANQASSLWPEFYQGAGVARLIHSPDAPPPPGIAAAAQRLGLALTPVDLTPQSGAEQCDLALAALSAPADIAGALPILTTAPDDEQGEIAIYDAALSLLPAVRRWGRPAGAASAVVIARAILSPPRHARETRKLREYQSEDTRAAPARFEYDLLLRAIGERPAAAAGPVDSWAGAAALAQTAGPASAAAIAVLHAEYDRADALALAYGRRWRSTLATRSFMLLLGNVMSGLVGTLFPLLVAVTVPVQLLATVLIFVDRWFATRRRWREKWIEYRRLAEAARIARICVLAERLWRAPGRPIGSIGDWRVCCARRRRPARSPRRVRKMCSTICAASRSPIRSLITTPPFAVFDASTPS